MSNVADSDCGARVDRSEERFGRNSVRALQRRKKAPSQTFPGLKCRAPRDSGSIFLGSLVHIIKSVRPGFELFSPVFKISQIYRPGWLGNMERTSFHSGPYDVKEYVVELSDILPPIFDFLRAGDGGMYVGCCHNLITVQKCSSSRKNHRPFRMNAPGISQTMKKSFEYPIAMDLTQREIFKRRKADERIIPKGLRLFREIRIHFFFAPISLAT
ncbi:hypothetical protein [Oligoflexus sp.]|uniref:hypothetical protein n=1 Tax=Oligoflexus sp. TaxID=1971216 RepID=UPI002D779263|nr:hypothetical protein [Oligoflexus sp.]